MPAQKITLELLVNTTTGTATARQVSGGQNASSASASRESGSRGGSAELASQISGKPVYGGGGSGVPFFLDPTNTLGSAARYGLDAALNPFLSGGQQSATLETQAKRAAAYTPFGTASGIAAASGNDALANKIDQAGKAIADMMGTLAEKANQIKSITSSAALNTVSGVAEQYASAGVSLSKDQLKRMYDAEEARQNRIVQARMAAAEASGNTTGKQSQMAIEGINNQINGLMGRLASPELQKSIDDARRLAEQQARGMAAMGAGNGIPTNR